MPPLPLDSVPLSARMTELAAVLTLLGLPALAIALISLRLTLKRRAMRAYRETLLAPYERLPHDCFRHAGQVFRLLVDPNPLFGRDFSVRLSTFVNSTLEFEVRVARNVPTKTPQRLASDPFYGPLVLDTPAPDETIEHLMAVKPTLARVLPSRWRAYSKVHCEVVLSANPTTPRDLGVDLEALAALAAVPAARRPSGGTWTIRSGFERDVPLWHWKPDQRARLPEGTRRWCVSAWYDNAYLNLALAKFLWRLGDVRVITMEHDLWFLEHAFGRTLPVKDCLAELTPEMAVAGDQWLDGELVSGLVAGAAPEAFRGAIKFTLHDRALTAGARLTARRLFDDEFSWFSGEYEILSASISDEALRSAFRETAEEFHAEVKEIDRPFSFKLLKEDRLEMSL
ncbi:MAG: hypothetical protein HYY16_14580 [Planctomycetes bacterium]|nr:hypothetical protein [Planctomycetota bacterium]